MTRPDQRGSATLAAVACAGVLLLLGAALALMSPKEREALLLVAWDGLTVPEAAVAAGCSTSAMHVRLFRARRRLRTAAASDALDDPVDDPAPATRPAVRPLPTGSHR